MIKEPLDPRPLVDETFKRLIHSKDRMKEVISKCKSKFLKNVVDINVGP